MSSKINLKITLFRLPFKYKLYYEEINKDFKKYKKNLDILTALEQYYKELFEKKSRSNIQITEINTSFPAQFNFKVIKTQTIKSIFDKIRCDKIFPIGKRSKRKKYKI